MLLLALFGCGHSSVLQPPPTTPSSQGACDDTEALAALANRHAAWFAELTHGLGDRPTAVTLPEDTNGALQVGLQGDALPILVGPRGAHAAATSFGEGRIVAFSGQDFLSSGTRSTLPR